MKKLKKNLQVVTKELKAMTGKTEAMAKKVAKLEKAQTSGKQKAKAKTTRPLQRNPQHGQPMTRSSTLSRRSKKGADVPTLIKKTGFEDKEIRNMVFRAAKHGKIKRTGREIYLGA